MPSHRCYLGFVLAVVALANVTRADDFAKAQGIWRSQGYGLALEITGDRFTLFEYTPLGRLEIAAGGRDKLEQELGTLRLLDDGRRLTTLDPTSIAPIAFERVEQLPGPRLDKTDSHADARQAVEIVWHTFNDHYAFFELRGVDWQAQHRLVQDRIRPESSAAELFDVLSELVSALGDNHVELFAAGFDFTQPSTLLDAPLLRKWRKEHQATGGEGDFYPYIVKKYREHVATNEELVARRLVGGPRRGANDRLTWGMLPGQIGYLSIGAMADYAQDDEESTQLAALEAALDRVLEDLREAQAMIVDVRFNGGGWDPAAVRIANRFADQRRAAFSKKARTADGFTPEHTIYVEPSGARQFTGPTLLLTSPLTASAAEIFTFCMKALPHVKQVGLPTMGIHSDMLVRHLPNGWRFSLSNEVYTFVDGKVYEKAGIPPDVEIAMFQVDDHHDAKDQVLERAIKLLTDESPGKQ